jgi:threonylcarbamoyladenosine tRNA methylthiotransferase MtaB
VTGRVHLRTLGCRLNQGEIDSMARQFSAQGFEIVDRPEDAEQIIVNTCAVTEDAVRSSRQLVRQLHRASPSAQITVTGCYAQIAPDAVAVLPGVANVVDNLQKDALVPAVTGQAVEPFDHEPMQRTAPVWMHRTRAFLKVQDGCDNACTFCVTTVARGAGRSRAEADILAEVRLLLAMGYQEIVLTGVHLGSYGHDRGERRGLYQLVRRLLSETDVPRIRLSSLEPWDLNETFFDLWQDARLCPHLHLPLQSGCDATLRRMLRRTTQREYAALIVAARQAVPDVTITTDVIVGFPGETDEEFAVSRAFIESMDFAGLHVFRYSRRPGTAAARMRGHLPESVRKARSAALIAYSEAQEQRHHLRFIGRTMEVLWENVAGSTEDGFINVGYTRNYLRVMSVHPRPLTNLCTPARLTGYDSTRRQLNAVPSV